MMRWISSLMSSIVRSGWCFLFIISISFLNSSRSYGGEEIRLLSFNVWGMPPLFGGGGCKGKWRYKSIGKYIKDYDIVAIQETWTKRSKKIVADAGYPYMASGKRAFKLFGGSGLVTLSRFPIEETEFLEFEKCTGFDCWVDKGILRTRIVLPDERRIDVYNLHMNAHAGKKANSVRTKQLQQVAWWIIRKSLGNVFIVMGDFNTGDDTDAYNILRRMVGAEDVYRNVNPVWHPDQDIANGYTYDFNKNTWFPGIAKHLMDSKRIDYIWLGGIIPTDILSSSVQFDQVMKDEQIKGKGRHLSDHFGVSGEFYY